MSRFTINTCILILCIFVVTTAKGQGKQELQQKKKELQKEIVYTNKLLNETAENKKASINQLVQLNKKIGAREELIQTMNQEIALIDQSIDSNQTVLDSLSKNAENTKG